MGCSTELASLPLLAGCPADEEWFLVGGATGGKGTYKYARRRYADIKGCIALQGIEFSKLKFEIGQPGSPLVAGETDLIITVNNPVVDSELVLLDNTPLEPDVTGQISYGVSYSTTQIIITFNQGVVDGQKYYIKYAKV